MGIRVKVKPTMVCYHHHKRWKEGEIFEIRNMQAFSKISMELVDEKAKPEVKKVDNTRSPAAISDGAAAALHEGKADNPKKAGEVTDKANEAAAASGGAETTGNEDVI